MARNFGVGSTNNVLPIKTLSSEYEADKAVGILTLRALQHALYAVLDHMEVAQMDLNQWQPTTVLGSSPLQVSQKDRPHRAEAVATSTASTVCAQAEKVTRPLFCSNCSLIFDLCVHVDDIAHADVW